MKFSLPADTALRLPNVGAVATAVVLCSCASIIHSTHQDVGISSNPTGAQVSVDGQVKGATPVVANLTRKDNHIVRIELAGYKPYETTLTRKVSGWVWGNIVFGGLIGLAVDAITGGLYDVRPEQISGQLSKTGASVQIHGDHLYVILVRDPDPSWRRIGQLEALRAR